MRVQGSGFGVQVSGRQRSGSRVWGLGYEVWCSGFRVFRVHGAELEVSFFVFRVQDSGLRIEGLGYGVRGLVFRV